MKQHTQLETRLSVVNSLDTMMETQPIDQIKVAALCRHADISRTTFYEYFDNIYAVAIWCWDQVLSDSLYQMSTGMEFYDAHVLLCTNLQTRRTFFKRSFRSMDFNSVYQYGTRSMEQYYFEHIPDLIGRPLSDVEKLEIMLYNAGAAWLTSQWAKDGMRESPQLMARAYTESAPIVLDCLK